MLLALGSLAFVVVGVLMLTVPPPPDWLPALAAVGGVLSLLLGLAGLGTVAHAATRPIMLLYPDRLVDARRQLTIAFAEIRKWQLYRCLAWAVSSPGGLVLSGYCCTCTTRPNMRLLKGEQAQRTERRRPGRWT